MFLNTLCVNSAKIHRALLKVKSGQLQDTRGKHEPRNKFPQERIRRIRDHINSFPCYRGHYCRKDLSCHLNLSLMFRLYKEPLIAENAESDIVSQSLYEKVFKTKFNLSFKLRHKDTCKKCDIFQIKTNSLKALENTSDNVKALEDVNMEKELRHRKVDLARATLRKDKETAINGECTVLAFDLQKTISLPKVPTGVVYYKRQLSCFSLGIHDMGTSKGTMHLWHERIAGRGPDEIGSCHETPKC
ncbi:uncharacterized protein LOC126234626 [Schistocerca nitens]|uniref:uncharacterized protein LOC126234626 n=1 Tax=Schistocerca nitens TaxID=7011 RepID=UPI002118610D|nr:uncharacterized protein LOC126234626 [Schistocerca nitens]